MTGLLEYESRGLESSRQEKGCKYSNILLARGEK